MNNRDQIHMKRKRNKMLWFVIGVWFVTYVAALQFWRFKYGAFEITAVYLVVGIPLTLLLRDSNLK